MPDSAGTRFLSPTGWRATLRGLWAAIEISYRADPRLFVLLVLSEASANLLLLFSTYSSKLVVDAALAGSVTGAMLAAAALTGSRAITQLAGHQRVNATAKLGEKSTALLDQRLMALTARLPGLEHEDRPDYADELALLRNNRWYLSGMATTLVLNLRTVMRISGATALLMSLHPALVVMPLFGLPPLLFGRWGNAIKQRTEEAVTERVRTALHLYSRATEAPAGKELRLFGLADELLARHRRLTDEVLTEGARADVKAIVLELIGLTCFAVGYVGAIGLVVWRAVNGLATAGDVVLAIALAAEMTEHVSQGMMFGVNTMRALRSTGRYLWLLDYERAARAKWAQLAPAAVPERLTDGITLEGASFGYAGMERRVLEDVSVHLPAGKVVALVGENGAGKSTLVKLLCQFYAPDTGRILVDGVDLQRLDPDAWRSRASAAFQDFRQFEFLVRETVGVGEMARMADVPSVERALQRAGADDVPAALPSRLETQLGRMWEGGVELSGGQWQKLALGRAFMRLDPLLVVFDEPTAAIDAPTEHALFERFAAAARAGSSRGTVTLIVSHRFSTVRMADLILVLEEGRIVERGSHAELMALGGTYSELYELQARAYR